MGELNSYQIKCELIKKIGGMKMIKKFRVDHHPLHLGGDFRVVIGILCHDQNR